MNLFFAMLVFSIVGFLGENVSGTQLGDIAAETPAHKAGFVSGDTILSVNGNAVNQWKEVKQYIETSTDKELTFQVKREETGAEETVNATPRLGKNEFIFSTDREVGRIDGLSLDSISTMVGVTNPESLAAQSGVKTFDIIESINGEPTTYWRQIERLLVKHASSGEWTLSVRGYDVKNKKEQNPRTIKFSTAQWKSDTSPLAFLGMKRSDLFLLSIKPKSPADVAGLKPADHVTKIDDQPVVVWQSVLDRVKSFKTEDGPIRFTVMRDGKEVTLPIAPERIDLPTEQGAMERRYAIGVIPAIMSAPSSAYLLRHTNPIYALGYGVAQSWEWTKLIAISFVRLIQNEVSARNIGGVITIGRVASNSFEAGISAFLKMMAIISINLFLLNLLPVPVLDGGHLVFFTIEALKGAPISFKKLEIAQQVGMVLLLSLMLFALFNDISNLISW
jgi:regulator of sigma E protease